MLVELVQLDLLKIGDNMKFKKKPVVIEAMQFDLYGHNGEEVVKWANSRTIQYINSHLYIETLEGVLEASHYDWIVKGVKGELYPCKPDIFALTYEPVVDMLVDKEADGRIEALMAKNLSKGGVNTKYQITQRPPSPPPMKPDSKTIESLTDKDYTCYVSLKDIKFLTEVYNQVKGYVGCADNSCMFIKPKGMATNGGCRCFRQHSPGLSTLAKLFRTVGSILGEKE